ncbi:protein FAM200A-like [Aphis craccivora]|uniref:Protein FAM200A-like n=1 Tax=Aphis craccivora TaxID=307492 RepID=A0A6G0VMC5_APHCR|nr:protein FAM200A-like [Aphis craccivora]
MFPLLTVLIKNIMTLPHSTACVERIFSMINLIKTKERNHLNTSNLIGLLHTKRALKDTNCYSMTII